MSSRQDEENNPRRNGLVPHSTPAPSNSAFLPKSGSAPLPAILSKPPSAPVSTSRPASRLAPLPPVMPPITDHTHKDRSEREYSSEPPTWPSFRPLTSREDRKESGPTYMRGDLGVRPTYPLISSATERYGSNAHFGGHELASHTQKHPHTFAPSDRGITPDMYDSLRHDRRYGSSGRFAAAAAVRSVHNGHLRNAPRINAEQSGNGSNTGPTFFGLVTDMISHPYFALMIKKVFEVCTEQEVTVPNSGTPLSRADNEACSFSHFAQTQGIDEACAQGSSLDVYLAGVLCSLEDLKKRPISLYMPHPLQDTITACGQVAMRDNHRQSAYPSVVASRTNYGIVRPISPISDRRHSAPVHDYRPIQPSVASAPRPKLSPDARRTMEEWFQKHYNNPYPTDDEKHNLARQCGIRLNQVNNFFGNKRMRLKRKAMTISGTENVGRVNAAEVDPSSVLAPRAKWRAMVLSKIPNGANGSTDQGNDNGSQIFDAPSKRARSGEYVSGYRAKNEESRDNLVPQSRSTE